MRSCHRIHFPCCGGRAPTRSASVRKILEPGSMKPSEKSISATNYRPYPKPICLQASWLRVSCQPSAHTRLSVADLWTVRNEEEFTFLERVTAKWKRKPWLKTCPLRKPNGNFTCLSSRAYVHFYVFWLRTIRWMTACENHCLSVVEQDYAEMLCALKKPWAPRKRQVVLRLSSFRRWPEAGSIPRS